MYSVENEVNTRGRRNFQFENERGYESPPGTTSAIHCEDAPWKAFGQRSTTIPTSRVTLEISATSELVAEAITFIPVFSSSSPRLYTALTPTSGLIQALPWKW